MLFSTHPSASLIPPSLSSPLVHCLSHSSLPLGRDFLSSGEQGLGPGFLSSPCETSGSTRKLPFPRYILCAINTPYHIPYQHTLSTSTINTYCQYHINLPSKYVLPLHPSSNNPLPNNHNFLHRLDWMERIHSTKSFRQIPLARRLQDRFLCTIHFDPDTDRIIVIVHLRGYHCFHIFHVSFLIWSRGRVGNGVRCH